MLGGVQGLVENDMFAAHLHAPLVAGLWVLDECARQNVLLSVGCGIITYPDHN